MEVTEDFKNLVAMALREDLGKIENNKTDYIGDITTHSTIDRDTTITAYMVSREDGVVAGVIAAQYVFNTVDPNLSIEISIQDGQTVKKGDKILTINGNAQSILQAERTALNFLTHLSGIATETAKYVAAVSHTGAKILDTRKTLPGWRSLQKYAVKMGGGENHRMGLYDMVLIKDNHIAAVGGVTESLNKVKKYNPDVKIEIEVDTLEQLQEVLNDGIADIVLLDNMTPENLKTAVEMSKGKVMTEASGGITPDTVKIIAESGIDYISIGALTHSVQVFDIGLDIN